MTQTEPQYDLAVIRNLLKAAFTAKTLSSFCKDSCLLKPIIAEFSPNQGLNDMIEEVIDYCETRLMLADLLAEVKENNPRQYERFRPYSRFRVFISYKRLAEPDEKLAKHLYSALQERRHSPFIDQAMSIGTEWVPKLHDQLESSDFMLVLISQESVGSEMVAGEIERAQKHKEKHGQPRILPIRVGFTSPLPYKLRELEHLQYALWQSEHDTQPVTEQVLNAVEGVEDLPGKPGRPEARPLTQDIPHPEAVADPRLLIDLEQPGAVVSPESKFYVKRQADDVLKRQVLKPGSLTYIRAARQTGKTSLLIQGFHHARKEGMRAAFVDCQTLPKHSIDRYLRGLAEQIADQLELGVSGVKAQWEASVTPGINMQRFLKARVLEPATTPVLLAVDKADEVYETDFRNDFFGLIRVWYNLAQWQGPWTRLSIAIAISTEPSLLIQSEVQSPFSVGTRIELEDFDEEQVADLNRRHGNPLSPGEVPEMTRFLGGHPFLTRKAMYVMVTQRLPWSQLEGHALDHQSPFGDHLRYCLCLFLGKPDLHQAMRQVVEKRTCPDDAIFHRLQAAGLIRRSGGQCVCRSDLYERYFRRSL